VALREKWRFKRICRRFSFARAHFVRACREFDV
jgi:hypothetical protein